MISSTTDIRVRYVETDRMGFAHHGNYLAWFELARVQMMDDVNYPYREMEEDGYLLPVLEVSVKYLRSVTFDDRVTIEATMAEKPALRMQIDYTVRCAGEITATGFTRHAFINRKGQPVKPPPRFRLLMNERFPQSV
jgi:acyl-CoA thioester hydrolase